MSTRKVMPRYFAGAPKKATNRSSAKAAAARLTPRKRATARCNRVLGHSPQPHLAIATTSTPQTAHSTHRLNTDFVRSNGFSVRAVQSMPTTSTAIFDEARALSARRQREDSQLAVLTGFRLAKERPGPLRAPV